jgi:hypothetical protein
MRLAQIFVAVKLWGLACLAASSLSAENIEAAGSFGIWSAFLQGNECWIAAHPQHSSGHTARNIYMFLSFFQGSPDFEISLHSQAFPRNISALTLQQNNAIYEMTLLLDTAYPKRGAEKALFWEMLRGDDILLHMEDTSGNDIQFVFDTYGFLEAYDFVSQKCAFNI